MLDRVENFQHSFGGRFDFFRVRAERLAEFILLCAAVAGMLVVGECLAQPAPSEPSDAFVKPVSVVWIDNEPAINRVVNLGQQLGAKAVSAFNSAVPVVPTDSQPVTKKPADNYADECAKKCSNNGVISPHSEKIMNVPHTPDLLWVFLSSFMAGISAGSVIAFLWTWFWYSDFAEWLFEKLYFFKAFDWIEGKFRR